MVSKLYLRKTVKEDGREKKRGLYFCCHTRYFLKLGLFGGSFAWTHHLCFSEGKRAQEALSFSSAHVSPCLMFANKGYSWELFGMPLHLWDTHFAGTLFHLLTGHPPASLLHLFTSLYWTFPNLANWAALAHSSNSIDYIYSLNPLEMTFKNF